MDNSDNGYPAFKMYDAGMNTVSNAVVYWYATQGFIGAQLCGIIAQNWLVNKACAMPGDDAIRKGYNVVAADGEELDPDAVKIIKAYDKAYNINANMREFIRKGRIFGIRIAMFKVMSTDPDYYEKPFNIDGVTAGSYKGIVQVDPYWTAPMLDGASASQPDSMHFYEPTWWIINGKKIHRSHLIIFRHAEPVDVLKPQYIYGGVPLTQQIMERVYAAERVSNEAPELALTKRTTVWRTDMEAVMANSDAAVARLNDWVSYRNNYGVKLGDKEGDEFDQFDTSLADFDALIMTQYQLVAAIACVPATKLIGTQPKGFNSTGDYEESSYHELLESIQTHDLSPLLERHHQLIIRSFVEPQLKTKLNVETEVLWNPLDSPTAEELAQTNYIKAQTDSLLMQTGALTGEDVRQRIVTDKTSGYNAIGIMENSDPFAEELAENDYLKVEDSVWTPLPEGEEVSYKTTDSKPKKK
jgi:phage-related protein (TIGR01555 family)